MDSSTCCFKRRPVRQMLQLVTKIFPLSSCLTVFIQTAFPLLIFPVFSQKQHVCFPTFRLNIKLSESWLNLISFSFPCLILTRDTADKNCQNELKHYKIELFRHQ